jgi:adiponectin receptor
MSSDSATLVPDTTTVAPFPPVRPRRSDDLLKAPAPFATSHPSSRTITFAELPAWAQDNEYIRRGYRRQTGSFRAALSSAVAYWHNETVNIHSHLFGALCAIAVLLVTFRCGAESDSEVVEPGRIGWQAAVHTLVRPFKSEALPSVDWRDAAGFAVFLAAAFACLGGSATYHCCSCHSEKV